MPELIPAYLMKTGQARHKGLAPPQVQASFRSELADVLGQVITLAQRHNINLKAAIQDKWAVWLPENDSDRGPTPPAITSP